jgi:hypothetical protein
MLSSKGFGTQPRDDQRRNPAHPESAEPASDPSPPKYEDEDMKRPKFQVTDEEQIAHRVEKERSTAILENQIRQAEARRLAREAGPDQAADPLRTLIQARTMSTVPAESEAQTAEGSLERIYSRHEMLCRTSKREYSQLSLHASFFKTNMIVTNFCCSAHLKDQKNSRRRQRRGFQAMPNRAQGPRCASSPPPPKRPPGPQRRLHCPSSSPHAQP